jgi:hypothetical protein
MLTKNVFIILLLAFVIASCKEEDSLSTNDLERVREFYIYESSIRQMTIDILASVKNDCALLVVRS